MTMIWILLSVFLVLHSAECGWRLADKLRRRENGKAPEGQPGETITDADRREAMRRERELANFMAYTGDEQPEIDVEQLLADIE